MRVLTEWQLAWLAGFIDGEGCLGIYERNGRADVLLRVTSTCLTVIDFIHTLTGVGSVFTATPGAKSLGSLPQKGWAITGWCQMRELMIELLPYLLVKAPQARMMLEFCNDKFSGNPTHNDSYYYKQTKVLNHSTEEVKVDI